MPLSFEIEHEIRGLYINRQVTVFRQDRCPIKWMQGGQKKGNWWIKCLNKEVESLHGLKQYVCRDSEVSYLPGWNDKTLPRFDLR